MSCLPGDQITWAEFYALGVKVDAAAVTLGSPEYSPLSAETDNPWSISEPVAATFWQRFTVDASAATPLVSARFMAGASGSSYSLPSPVLEAMAEAGDLYFLADADGCFCKTRYKVIKEGSVFTLDTSDAIESCCQTLAVPDIGDLLGYGQNIIPAAWATQYANITLPADTASVFYLAVNKCVTVVGGVEFQFAQQIGDPTSFFLTYAARQMTGVFTWKIKREWMDILHDKIAYIIDCAANSGAKPDLIKSCDTGEYIEEGCPVTFPDFQYSLGDLWMAPDDPGCLTQCALECLPWNSDCCTEEQCETLGNKVYCETVHQLDTLIDKLTVVLKPYDADIPCPTCCGCPLEASNAGCGDDTTVYPVDNAYCPEKDLYMTLAWTYNPGAESPPVTVSFFVNGSLVDTMGLTAGSYGFSYNTGDTITVVVTSSAECVNSCFLATNTTESPIYVDANHCPGDTLIGSLPPSGSVCVRPDYEAPAGIRLGSEDELPCAVTVPEVWSYLIYCSEAPPP